MEEKLFLSMDYQDDGPSVVFSKDGARTRESRSDLNLGISLDPSQGQRSQTLFLPHSPSSPGSLADLSASSEDVPLAAGLVKSSSIDLESRESGSLKGKPLLSLVKSLSTEISRRVEPDVNLSKSDSKLHLHPWRPPRIPEARANAAGPPEKECRATFSSAGNASPTEPRGSSLMAELEDTRRKFSEAMQDPLSMLSKIMGDESSGSPKQCRTSSAGDSPSSQGSAGRDGGREETSLKCRRRADGDRAGESAPKRPPKGSSGKNAATPEQRAHRRDARLEIHTYGDILQVVELRDGSGAGRRGSPFRPGGSALPLRWLFLVGFLAYGLFVLPLPSYVTGLSLGVACGFLLGLVVVFLFAPRRCGARRHLHLRKPRVLDQVRRSSADPEVLEGWMTVTHVYDPETFLPSAMHSVYVALEGGRLCLQYPAASTETSDRSTFSRSCTYRLENCTVTLAPPGLARKRVWNKKYPVCITLADGETGEETLIGDQEEEGGTERQSVPEHQLPVTLYLFGRTGREKEEWFQHFLLASKCGTKGCVSTEESTETACDEDASRESAEEAREFQGAVKARTLLDYTAYMSGLIGSEGRDPASSSDPDAKIPDKEHGSHAQAEARSGEGPAASGASADTAWVNSLVGRIFWDFLRDKYWTDQVAHKIQKKLTKIKLPYFMNELTLADLDMGSCLPQVLSTSRPTLDHRGLWLEMELMYTGCLLMTLETKMNLCKLGKEEKGDAGGIQETQASLKPRMCTLADSDEESSSAGSSDEEEAAPCEPQGSAAEKGAAATAAAPDVHGGGGGSTGRKILRFVDKIAKSKYFQKATENEYIKKKIAEVSNMPLMLSVEVLELSGTLAVNIPPPPTDRIWYSFQVPPRLDLHVRPMLGEREVTFIHVTEWIEKKLQCEFQKVLVMPNMDDIYLPLMTPGVDDQSASHHSSLRSTSHQSSVESQDYLSE